MNARRLIEVCERDASPVCDFMVNMCGPHSLDFMNRKDVSFSYRGSGNSNSNITFGYLAYGTETRIGIGAGIGHYSISLPRSGRQTVVSGSRRYQSGPLQAVILSPGEDVEVDLDRDWRSVFVTINKRIMDLALGRLIGAPVTERLVFDVGMPTSDAAASSWWRTAEHYLRELAVEDSLLCDPSVYRDFELSLVRALLIRHPNNYSDEIRRKIPDMMPGYLRKAVKHIEDSYPEQMRLEDLGRIAGVPTDRLTTGFREFLGATPMQYLKNVRLLKAREMLMTSGARKNVSTIAFDVGFNHLGRFSVDYKAAFGEAPSQTSALAGSRQTALPSRSKP
ncbi:AraC family transcriptional regulator [Pararhodobacter sp.]|uniref:AraC family transcriptional regulator n=1 Tax=Pararhodobacter sp. TaxID=2127056 RepID=UPI002AFE6B4A|nr:AraC family transcriptional regulator [Pararhodobacter sp.]